MDQHDIPFIGDFYTKAEVDKMVADALEEARAIDEASMADHNFKATIISMVLGFICLALFLDGTLRLLGIIPPFMDIDCLLYTSPSPRDRTRSRMPSSA